MQKIVITGGIGYIGTELCRLYSGESRFKKITVVDNRFISERVAQLRDWGIDFVHGDILDKKLMKELLADTDIVHHLAGITDVAYTKTESNTEKDRHITEVGVEGSRNVIECAPKHCKILFPSTHVVYEGFDDTRFDITEDVPPTPVLTYSKGKAQTEKDLLASEKNYVILRLGSNYGYSGDTMRINIMPNLFSKIASQNGTISLFSGGVQHKSLVSVQDVARCLKYMAEKNDITREIVHCSRENMTVKEVAKLCKKFNPKLTLSETKDEIPNLGYTLSNKKLLAVGFDFKYNIESSVKEMIERWSQKKIPPDLEYIIRGIKEFTDARGKISNYELTEPVNLIGYIESKKGTVRANHYHPIQEQKCLLVSGQYISVIKDLSVQNAPIETRVINAGDLSVIKPNVAHAMIFTEDSVFLNLVRGEREHENYGVTHTIPYPLVDERTKNKLLATYKTNCRVCGNKHLKRVLSLGESPLANNLAETDTESADMYPLEMNYCSLCHNCQLSVVVPPQKMFDHYLYISSTSPSFRKHFIDAAQKYIKDFNLENDSFVIDIGSNDGIALRPFKEAGFKVLGIEPAGNIAKIANESGIETMRGYFDTEMASKIRAVYGLADIITASNVFAHADDLKGIARDVFALLKERGIFIIEAQYLLDTVKDLTFDNIYHEHVNYWSVTSLNHFFKSLGCAIVDVEHIDTHGGSIRVYVQRAGNIQKPSVEEFLNKEKEYGLLEYSTYQKFAQDIAEIKKRFNARLNRLRDTSRLIVGYGSPAKATTALNYFCVSPKQIAYIIEDNKLKHGKYLPGINIPIKSKDAVGKTIPDIVIIFAWNFAKEIEHNNQELVKQGARFISVKDMER